MRCHQALFLWLAAAEGWRATTVRRGPGRRTLIRRMKELDEVLKGADAYDGAGVTDPYYQHPDTLPQLHEWTAETFEADLDARGPAARVHDHTCPPPSPMAADARAEAIGHVLCEHVRDSVG